jgi:DNA-binding response OmpR family regulator
MVRAMAALGDTVPMRVLVVEDERRLAAAVKRGLEASGFAVDLAFDGVTGLHMAREGGYDGVVLDIMLPGMSGYSVCTQLRAEENWVPLLFLSAKDGEYDLADGLDIGADDYLVKPFSYVVLAARLRALLRRGRCQGLPCCGPGTWLSTPDPGRCSAGRRWCSSRPGSSPSSST